LNPPEHDTPRLAAVGEGQVFEGLNESQHEAVRYGRGPLLVLAGAGSGKTRVITCRIAHLIRNSDVPPACITAMTFTNKAATEMRERVEGLLGPDRLGCWIGTFHSLCLRILRREGHRIGLASGFNIYDTDDQLALVKRILKQEALDDTAGKPRSVLSRISRAKNALESADELERRAFSPRARAVAQVYRLYDAALRKANAVDFDDLLVLTVKLFNNDEEARRRYSRQCEYLLVDEYQDTNRPQYRLIRHLTATHGNVCVVGDEDQSIYRFRGAELKNILDFEHDYPGTRTIRLEQNYRSTGAIIEAAGAVIANNLHRKGKTLWTENARGDRLQLFRAPDDRVEAAWVAGRVNELSAERTLEEFTVLYRTNAQSRQIEEIFRRERIPYQIVGSVQFYERKEIKDLLAYLRLAANPADLVSFRRIVNTPARGIGQTTLEIVDQIGRNMGMLPLDAAAQALDQGLLKSRPATNLARFVGFIADLTDRAATDGTALLLEHVLEHTAYADYLKKSYPENASERMENIRSLISAAVEHAEEGADDSLQAFLDRSALVASADDVGSQPGVTLMTIHCAKGLEFPVVFLIGLEENLFPHMMAASSDEDIEEERRLCYVAMTRAKEKLFLTHARYRRYQGTFLPNAPSRFLDEVPAELVRVVDPQPGAMSNEWRTRETARSSGSSAARAAARARTSAPSVPSQVAQPDPGDGYGVGARVRHPRFGAGQILGREGSGKNLKLTIHFDRHGTKKILPAYTKLANTGDAGDQSR